MFKRLKIGIISGAGPMAGVVLTKKIIQKAQHLYGCYQDEDFPEIFYVNIPFSQMLNPNSQEQREDLVKRELEDALGFLMRNNVHKILIACNTLHCFLSPELKDKVVHLIQHTNDFMKKEYPQHDKSLLLSSYTTFQSSLYDEAKIIKPNLNDQKTIHDVILKIISGKHGYQEKKKIEQLFFDYQKKDPTIKNLLLGCTEFSVLHEELNLGQLPHTQRPYLNDLSEQPVSEIGIIDPLDIIAHVVLEQ